jgi:methylated-DNA-[protein]-cysteine S-methyltransferase
MDAEAAAVSLKTETIETPIGPLFIVANEADALLLVEFADCRHRIERWLSRRACGPFQLAPGLLAPCVKGAFSSYFDGKVTALDALTVRLVGTAFHRQVWTALRSIPAGETCGYGAFAEQLGRPAAARAVGHANGANPLSIVVPCHRLVGASGSLTNYGGGLARKRWLLDHEARYAVQS